MKIPESVRIAGVEYKVNIVPNLMNGSTAAYGHIDYDNSTIELSDTCCDVKGGARSIEDYKKGD